jgi:hypothetical protein
MFFYSHNQPSWAILKHLRERIYADHFAFCSNLICSDKAVNPPPDRRLLHFRVFEGRRENGFANPANDLTATYARLH